MKEITDMLSQIYFPYKSLVIYKTKYTSNTLFQVESFDFSESGKMINAHPLTLKESSDLAVQLFNGKEQEGKYLNVKGLMPPSVLGFDADKNGKVIWFTQSKQVRLLFLDSLGIPSGKTKVPPMIWVANRKQLSVYSFKGKAKPTMETELFHAPFFNIHTDGKVCMGTTSTEVESCLYLEDFIFKWEHYFWNSYFSHLLGERSQVKGNIVQLWKNLVGTKNPFPTDVLLSTKQKLKSLFP